MALMEPSRPCTAVSSSIKWGWCFHSGLTPSYLTDVLWGLMKLCLQCFQFLEKNYVWTLQVLRRYISDLSFLLAVILVCCFYNVMATSDGYQSSELPSWAPGRCRFNCSWDHRGCLPHNWEDGPGHRSQRPALGSGLGWYTSMPQHSGRRPLTFTPQALRGLDYGLRPSVCPSSCLQGCMVGSYASWKMNFVIGPDANLHVDSLSLPLTFFLRANGRTISTLISEGLACIDALAC